MLEKLTLIAVGFVITGVIGGIWSQFLKRKSWVEQTKHSIYSSRYEDGIQFLDEISEVIGKRLYLLQSIYISIQREDKRSQEKFRESYRELSEIWNANAWKNRNKIRLLLGEKQANVFLDFSDEYAGDKPESLHFLFWITYKQVLAMQDDPTLNADTKNKISILQWKCTVYLEHLTSTFIQRAKTLQLMEEKPD